MDNLSIFLFAIAGISTLVGAFYLMASAANSKPVRDYNAGRLTGEWTAEVTKPVHPEMQNVKPGEELMGVTFKEPKTECSLEEYKDLQARIEILRAELGGEDTLGYVKFKLAEAGYSGELPISASDLGNIHNSANGIPGTINALVVNALEETSVTRPSSDNLPSFFYSGNHYWVIAATLFVLLVFTFVVLDPDPRIEQQRSLAASETSIEVSISAQANLDPIMEELASEIEPMMLEEQKQFAQDMWETRESFSILEENHEYTKAHNY